MKHLFVLRNQRGFVMLTCMALLLMFGILGVSMVNKSSDDMDVAGYQLRDVNALYAAEAAADYAYALFNAAIDSTDAPPNPLPVDSFVLDRYHVQYATLAVGTPTTRNLTTGAFRGLYGLVQDYDLWGYARSDASGVQNSVRIRMERALIPIFQFAIFYDKVLEWHPGPVMTLSGRVHSNGDTYLGSNNGLTINSFLTAAGSIYHGRDPASGMATGTGYVRIKDKDGVDRDMRNPDGTWLDHNESQWMQKALDRWGGQVQDVDHGMTSLNLPLEASNDPHAIIEDASAGNTDSYENKATLKILDGQAYFKSGGSWVNVTADLTSSGVLSTSSFYDGRNAKTVNARDIDISKLNTSAYWPSNGIVYTKDTYSGGNLKATRLINGSSLKSGLTVVSENPVYTKGNYNSTSKKPAAIFSDAYTVLSTNWQDSNSTKTLTYRNANPTTVNVSFITGNVASVGGNYSGGVENFPRFLENWSGDNFTWSGSMVQMWYSEQATAKWGGTGGYYNPPNRVWQFDTDLLDPTKLPPGTPMVNAVVKRGWANTGGPIAGS
ncbi:MAG: hypothetical protein AB1792_01865 [Candidatus Zixiibacteriota bacterium]